jgi:hypothetical protein
MGFRTIGVEYLPEKVNACGGVVARASIEALGVPYVPMAIGKRVWTYWAPNYWPWELRRLINHSGFFVQSTGVCWLTFENITGKSRFVRVAKPLNSLTEA